MIVFVHKNWDSTFKMKGATRGVVTGKAPKFLLQKHSDLSIFKLGEFEVGVGGGGGGANLNIGDGGVAGDTEATETGETGNASFSTFVSIKASFPPFCSSFTSDLSSFKFFISILLTSQLRRRLALVAFRNVSVN